MKSLSAILGVGLTGIFIGALAMEIIHRKNPKLISNLQSKAQSGLDEIEEGFKKGFKGEPTDE